MQTFRPPLFVLFPFHSTLFRVSQLSFSVLPISFVRLSTLPSQFCFHICNSQSLFTFPFVTNYKPHLISTTLQRRFFSRLDTICFSTHQRLSRTFGFLYTCCIPTDLSQMNSATVSSNDLLPVPSLSVNSSRLLLSGHSNSLRRLPIFPSSTLSHSHPSVSRPFPFSSHLHNFSTLSLSGLHRTHSFDDRSLIAHLISQFCFLCSSSVIS